MKTTWLLLILLLSFALAMGMLGGCGDDDDDEDNGSDTDTDTDTDGDGGTCPDPGNTPVGSCIFLYETTSQHYCEDYSGPGWTAVDAEGKCATRTDGVYEAAPCEDRGDETSEIDGDGVYKGACIIACGDLEYIWQIYSGTAEDIAPFCTEGFILPNGEPL